ncbi:hypothetical protein CHS0354_008901 [Potamilus streckersoni]|uniref:glutathione-specific gamma-glutamylcyclotransferase n=1 Tax=Potamilus streckersoni TaxID=2493646 RepID=A0AAE0W4C7_9BIVA|nr:hypothetical protein CHS0354_008901 [Potamilus streckersoni]
MDIQFVEHLLANATSVTIFGYGSLLWKPDFTYKRRQIGHITGFVRRFYQGNITHRGTPETPGRCATLVKSSGGSVWGVAFDVEGTDEVRRAMCGLNLREMTLGGYILMTMTFYPRDGSPPRPVLVYTATEHNSLYLGSDDTPIEDIAKDIVAARGFAGSNIEYVTKMADFVREHIPEDDDEHLFSLDRSVRNHTQDLIQSHSSSSNYERSIYVEAVTSS